LIGVETYNSVGFDFNVNMQYRGGVALELNYATEEVYFTLAQYTEGTAKTGPILVGKISDLTAGFPATYEAWEYYPTESYWSGLHQLELSSD
jgi:hypothetical protein